MKVTKDMDLTDFLLEKTNYSKTKIKHFFKYKSVYVNNKLVPYTCPVKIGDEVQIKKTKQITTENNKRLNIVYEDKNYLVVNKPARLLTVANETEKKNTLYHAVREYVKGINKNYHVYIVHRLDKDTSGLVMFVKNEKLKHDLQTNWNNLAKVREYVAIVNGRLEKKKDKLVNKLVENSEYMVFVSNKNEGETAITNYEVIKENSKYSMLKVLIETGKKNQIRVQLDNIGNPIIGDKKYGIKGDPLKRLGLHANVLEVIDPITNKLMHFETAVPRDFIRLMSKGK